MNWKKWSCLALALAFVFVTVLPVGAAATATEPAPTEPSTEPAMPSGPVVALMLLLGLVILVMTWVVAIWLMRKVLSEPKNRL